MKHCKFRTSYGAELFCQDAAYLEGFCKFHYSALQNGEMNAQGVLNELIPDQARRREINLHGIRLPGETYLEDRR